VAVLIIDDLQSIHVQSTMLNGRCVRRDDPTPLDHADQRR